MVGAEVAIPKGHLDCLVAKQVFHRGQVSRSTEFQPINLSKILAQKIEGLSLFGKIE